MKNELSLKEQKVGSTKPSLNLMLMEEKTQQQVEAIKQREEQTLVDTTRVERTIAAAQDLVHLSLSLFLSLSLSLSSVCVRDLGSDFCLVLCHWMTCSLRSNDLQQQQASRVDNGEDTYEPQTLDIVNQSGQKVHLLPEDQR